MLLPIVIIYFLGLGLLLLSDLIGLLFFRFRTISLYLGVLLGYLSVITGYAIIKTNGNTVGLLVLIWLFGYVFFIHKSKDSTLIKSKEYFQRIIIICLLWSAIFLLKASFFWNNEYHCPNLLFVDNEFYMKVAEGFNLSGHENAMGLKNILFPFLDFAQPYRSNDFWLVSFGLDITKWDTIFIWELFYSTIILFMCSLSLFVLLKSKFSLIWSLFLAIIMLFAFSGSWYPYLFNLIYPGHSGGFDPIGIVAYTKLAIVFSILFQFFHKYENEKKMEALYLLILIPLLVQSTIAIFLIVFALFLNVGLKEILNKNFNYKRYISFFGLYSVVIVGFLVFYFFNQQQEQHYIGNSNLNVLNNSGIIDFIIQFFKKSTLLFISYYWISFLIVIVLLFSTKTFHNYLRIELVVFLFVFYFSSILVYAWFNKIGDAYQFATNVFGPFVLALILYLFIQTPINTTVGKLKIGFLIFISIVGMNQMIGGNNFFHSASRINYYNKSFIAKVKNILPQLQYPLGIIYYGKDLQNNYKEDYPQHDSAFLKLFGRNYDVFNIEADSLKMDHSDQSLQKINLSIKKNAFNIWKNNAIRMVNSTNKLSRKDFYDAYPFSFCISKISKDSLPEFIKADIVSTIKDSNSKIYFYTLNRK